MTKRVFRKNINATVKVAIETGVPSNYIVGTLEETKLAVVRVNQDFNQQRRAKRNGQNNGN